MLSELAIWYLRKRKKTVIINVESVGGMLTQLERSAYLYDNRLINTVFYDCEDIPIVIPEGKF
ncbi:hypothetical protein [Oceanobacillus kimchii]